MQVYTGNGKGKTTAALGLALRALGQGLRVHIIFFMKGLTEYGEQKALAAFPGASLQRFGSESFVDPFNLKEEEREQARLALQAAREAMVSGHYEVLILDEVNLAAAWKLLPVEEVLQLIAQKPPQVELILTGRYAPAALIEAADVVTEMVEIKHPYRRGVLGRRGIEY